MVSNASTLLKAAEAGVDIVDGAIASMSGATSQPNLNSMVEALRHTERDTGLDSRALSDCSVYWDVVRTYYRPFDNAPKSGSADIYRHEIPGGQFTNFAAAGGRHGLGHRWREVEKMYADVNQLFGDIVKVTPSSKVVGDMALFLLSHGMTCEDVLKLKPGHGMGFPDSVRHMMAGGLGNAAGRLAAEGSAHSAGRPQGPARPAGRATYCGGFPAVQEELEKKLGRKALTTNA